MVAEVDVRIVSDPRWLRLARSIVNSCCREFGISKADSRAIVSALNEALTNVMRHAYRGDRTRPILIACRRVGAGIELEISDHGREFDPVTHPSPPPDELRVGGRGLFLIRESVDELRYFRDGDWNRLRMRKHPSAVAGKR